MIKVIVPIIIFKTIVMRYLLNDIHGKKKVMKIETN